MTTQLLWTGTDDVDVFVDTETNDEYHPSERPHEVPDERVDWLLDHDGWERPDAQTAGDDDTVRTLPASEPSGEDESQAVDGFDADAFIDDNWQSVQSAIRGGEADGHLEAVEAAERDREGGPREDSVLEAIEQRRGEVNAE